MSCLTRRFRIPTVVIGIVGTLSVGLGTILPAQSFEGIHTAQRNLLSNPPRIPSVSSHISPQPALSDIGNEPIAATSPKGESPAANSADVPSTTSAEPQIREESPTEASNRVVDAIGVTPSSEASPLLDLVAEGLESSPTIDRTQESVNPAPAQPNLAAVQATPQPDLQPPPQTQPSSPLAANGTLPSFDSAFDLAGQVAQPDSAAELAPSQPQVPAAPVTSSLPENVSTSPTDPALAFTPHSPAGYVEISNGIYVPESFLKADSQFRQSREARYQAWAVYQAQLAQQSSMIAALLPYETLYGNSISPGVAVSYSGMVNRPTPTDRFPLYPLSNAVPISSNYGWRTHPITGQQRFHTGIDLATATGTPVLASLSGVVEYAGSMDGYGNTVILRHLDGSIQTLYAHLSTLYVEVGESVKQGQPIALSGSTGNSTGPHLHFEIRQRAADGWSAIDINQIVAFAQSVLQSAQATAQAAATIVPPSLPFELTPPAKPSLLSEPLTSPASQTALRVALEVNVSALTVGASTPMMVTNTNGQLLTTLSAMQAFDAVPTPAGIALSGRTYNQPIFVAPANGGMIALNGHYYRGKLLLGIQPTHTGITAINWVDLEQYLYSVVPSEAYPSWGKDALQAQAIAARSYAMYYRQHPVSPDWYDLCSDTRYQAYNGAESEVNTTTAAVNATRSQVLVQNNEVLQALYASTDALSVSAHNGVGMSQWGAADMAAQGQSYLTILGHYYPGATLSAIQ